MFPLSHINVHCVHVIDFHVVHLILVHKKNAEKLIGFLCHIDKVQKSTYRRRFDARRKSVLLAILAHQKPGDLSVFYFFATLKLVRRNTARSSDSLFVYSLLLFWANRTT